MASSPVATAYVVGNLGVAKVNSPVATAQVVGYVLAPVASPSTRATTWNLASFLTQVTATRATLWNVSALPAQQTRYDASALTGLSDGAAVSSWPDSSGNGYTASPGSAATYKTGIAPTGKPVVRFAGNWYTTVASAQSGSHTIAAVVRPTGSGTARTIMGSTGGFGPIQVRFEADNKLGLLSAGRVAVGSSPSALSTTNFSVILITASNTAWSMRVNGSVVASGGGVDYVWSGNRELGGMVTGSETMTGDVAEVMTWESVLNSTDIATIEGYLSDKWLGPQPVTATRSTTWNLASFLTQVTATRATTWNTNSIGPDSFSQIVLWLRAKDLTGVDGATVTSWPDQSGASHSPTSLSGTIVKTGITPAGGKVARLSTASIPLPNLGMAGDGEMYMVMKNITTDTSAWKFGTSGLQNHYPYSGQIYTDFGHNARDFYTPTMSVSSQFRILRSVITAGSIYQEYLDEVLQISGPVTVAWNTGPSLSIGWSGDIAEVYMRNTVATTGERAAILNYLNSEHGLSVPVPLTVTATRATTWNTNQTTTQVTATRATTWNVGAPGMSQVTATRATTWNVAALSVITVTATRATTWNVRKQVSTTVATTWAVQILLPVTALRLTTWNVAALPTTQVTALRPTTWNVAAATITVIEVRNPAVVKVGGASAGLWSLWYPFPVAQSGTQALNFSIVPTSPEESHPVVYEGDEMSNSLWMSFISSDPQDLTITLSTGFDAGIEVWTGYPGEAPDDLSNLAFGQGTITVPIGDGQRILMRAHPLSDTETGSGSITWSVVSRAETGVVDLSIHVTEVTETPGWIPVGVISATPGGDLDFTLDGTTALEPATADDDGSLPETSILLPMLTPGAHTIMVTDMATGQTDSEPFTVRLEPVPPESIPGNTPPTTGVVPDEVIHWVLEDPMPGGLGAYTFPINPQSMSPVHFEKALRAEHTVYPGGANVVWEGQPEPVNWDVQGRVQTQVFYDALVAYESLNRRIYVIDHHQRAWICGFESVEFTKTGRQDDWNHSYRCKFWIVGGPVSLS